MTCAQCGADLSRRIGGTKMKFCRAKCKNLYYALHPRGSVRKIGKKKGGPSR